VLENDAEYKRWAIERKNAARMEQDHAALEARREALRKLRGQSLANIGPADAMKLGKTRDSGMSSSQAPTVPAPANTPSQPADNVASAPAQPGRNFTFGGGDGGGGAIDPVSGLVLLSVAGMGLWSARRRGDDQSEND
jgi:hypothetical protein